MACIGKITGSLAAPCGVAARADLRKPLSAKILNASDIASFTVDNITGNATITRIPTGVGYEVTTINNSLVITVGLKSQDITPGAFDVSITFKSFSGVWSLLSRASVMGAAGHIATAELVIAVDHGDRIRVYGLGAPLVCTEVSGDSSASEYITYTFGVEDWQVGTTVHGLTKADYDALSTPAPTPGT